MQSKRSRLALLGILALALSVTAGVAVSDVAAAKKKKKTAAGGTADIAKAVNAPIPDGTATTDGLVVSTIDVGGKTFAGTKVRDVNATIQLIGVTGISPISDVAARVTAPNGATTWLFGPDFAGTAMGPLTLDDESPNRMESSTTPPRDPTELTAPYVGSAQPDPFNSRGGVTFSAMDNGPASGTWTLRVYDTVATETSILTQWRITVVAGKAFKTKP